MKLSYFKLWVLLPFFHILMVYGLLSDQHWLLILVLGVLLQFPIHHLGHGIGHHRLFSHNAFDPVNWYPYVSVFLSSISFFGDPLGYAIVHRLHHRYADTAKDPHSPKDGFFHSYIGWITKFNPTLKQKLIVADLIRKYKWMLSYSKFEWTVPIIFYAILFSINTTAGYIVLFASLLSLHSGALVNSLSHSKVDIPGEKHNAIDNVFLANTISPSFLHKYHHSNGSLYDYTHPGYTDRWARVIKRFLMRK